MATHTTAAQPAVADQTGTSARAVDATLITVAYNNDDEIHAVLAEAIAEFGAGPLVLEHLIIWNSARPDVSDTDHGSYLIRHIDSARNVGFGRAFNLGAARAAGSVLLSLNADATLSKEQLTELVRLAADRPDTLFAPPLISNHEVTYGRRFYSLPDVLRVRFHRRNPMLANDPNDVDWVLGACFAVSAELWQRMGGFDERYFLYFEDVDLCWRLWHAGNFVEVATVSPVRHIHNRASARLGRPLAHHLVSAARYFSGVPARCRGKRPQSVRVPANG